MTFRLFKKNNYVERRRHERVDLFQSTFCNIHEETSEQIKTCECWINNISLGGLSMEVKLKDLSDKTPTHVKVLYKLGTNILNDTLSVRSRQIMIQNWRLSCEFNEKNEDRSNKIMNYIAGKF